MPELNRYLTELDSELRKSLPKAEVDSLVQEAKTHLLDSIQARLELGVSPEEAEAQAVAAFGKANRLRDEIRRREPWIDRRFLLAGLGLILAAWSNSFLPTILLVPLLFGLHIAFVVTSMTTRRPQVAALLILLPFFLVGTATIDATQIVTQPSNGLTYLRYRVPTVVSELRAQADWLSAQPGVLAQGLSRYAAGEIELAPSPHPTYSHHRGALKLRKPSNRAEGLRQWKEAQEFMARSMPALAESQRRGADSLEQAASLPWPVEIPNRMAWVLKSPGLTEAIGAFVTAYFLAWGIGVLLRRHPRYRNGAHV